MRIVAGRWRGRRIAAPPGKDVRPTLDRVREAWMSIVQPYLVGAKVVDLFAGSGALGLEALSRGAAVAHFVERHAKTFAVLQQNVETLGAGSWAVLYRQDVFTFLRGAGEGHCEYDVAFADPPYGGDDAAKLAACWLEKPFAKLLGIEHDSRVALPGNPDARRYGTTAISFFRQVDL
ncbi:MAG: 16S rRNA (guanine(966)-N(2))-methyltransferase RsmD [Gemmatimonadaceae bacterium]